MKNPIIFLDIDGVLKLHGAKDFDYSCVKNLVDVLFITGAKVVISSDWRIGGIGIGSDLHKNLLKAGGDLIFSRIIGHTPINDFCRMDQIGDFIDQNFQDKDNIIFIRIDDDGNVGDIITDQKIGFDQNCKDKFFKMLEN